MQPHRGRANADAFLVILQRIGGVLLSLRKFYLRPPNADAFLVILQRIGGVLLSLRKFYLRPPNADALLKVFQGIRGVFLRLIQLHLRPTDADPLGVVLFRGLHLRKCPVPVQLRSAYGHPVRQIIFSIGQLLLRIPDPRCGLILTNLLRLLIRGIGQILLCIPQRLPRFTQLIRVVGGGALGIGERLLALGNALPHILGNDFLRHVLRRP